MLFKAGFSSHLLRHFLSCMYISAKEIVLLFCVTGANKVCSTIARDLNNSIKLAPEKAPLLPPAPPKSNPNELAKLPNPPPAAFPSSKA